MTEWVAQADPSQNPLPELGVPVEPLPAPSVEEAISTSPVEPPLDPAISNPSLERILIRQIDITGSTVFMAEDLLQGVEPYANQLLTVAELQVIAAEITQLYLPKIKLSVGRWG
jgi:hemolysin activation/secretion protein